MIRRKTATIIEKVAAKYDMLKAKEVEWTHRLAQLYTQVTEHQDAQTAHKIIDLLEKYHKKEFHLVFCGHFSAGKSSLLNELFGQSILPTSPIPTSANVVKVKKGTDQLKLRLSDQSQEVYQGTYTETQFQMICKQGGEITEIELTREDFPLPKGVTLVDTPGIDSTDPLHRQITEAALHLADMIYYVMDYNHVQAETNLQFIKELTDRGKQVALIVNQIDKHRSEEISFAAYQESILTSLSNWQIDIHRLFFLSLKEKNHPHNQLPLLHQHLQQLISEREQWQVQTVDTEVRYLVEQHLAAIKTEQPAADLPSLLSRQTELTEQIHQLDEQITKLRNDFIAELEKLFQNAYLMPASIRDLAHAYLESLQADFKVGFFFSKTKTNKEQIKRRDVFYQAMLEVIETQIQKHLFALLEKFAKEQDLWTDELGTQIKTEMPIISADLLRKARHDGAVLTGPYLLTYTDELSKRVTSIYRTFSNRFVDRFFQQISDRVLKQKNQLSQQLQQLATEIRHAEQAQAQTAQAKKYEQELRAMLSGEQVVTPRLAVEQLLGQRSAKVVKYLTATKATESTATKSGNHAQRSQPMKNTADKLAYFDQVIALLHSQPKLASFYKTLKEKREQFEQQQFTVVLFGAFSAGKSSFINALIGDAINPVSPHPTTATITKICPPTDTYHHGQAIITYKSKKELFLELQQIYRLFQQEVEDLPAAIKGIASLLRVKQLTPSQKLAVPYLTAVKQGFKQIQSLLGSKVTCQHVDLVNKIGKEEEACFIQEAAFYYDSIFAQLGITLVDTPGANSVHARHTDVAFQYMKQADAIIYLTYYNHAFSGADREFLIQLGRVQDVFTTDKMFFLINAVDLATSEQERDTVIAYVSQQLRNFGLRNPRLFAVSSLLAMEEETKPLSGIVSFVDAFRSFMQEDLQTAFLASMQKTVEQTNKWIEQMKLTTQLHQEEKEKQKMTWKAEQERIQKLINQFTTETDRESLLTEIKELLYYVKQRLMLRYQDTFAEFINPSTITKNGRTGKKQLTMAMDELYLFMERDILQELRALSLRLEYWIRQRLVQVQKQMQQQWQQVQPNFVAQEFAVESFPELEWEDQIAWDGQTDTYQACLAEFKNQKMFFEQDGKKRLQEILAKGLQVWMVSFLNKEEARLQTHFTSIWEQQVTNWKAQYVKQLNRFYQDLFISTEQTDDTDWAEVQQRLVAIKLPDQNKKECG